MSNPNSYTGVRMNSNHIVNEMRRINAIEKRTFRHHASWGGYGVEFDDTCLMTAGGGKLFVLGGLVGSEDVVRVFSPTGSLLETWAGSFSGRMCYYNGEIYCAAGASGVIVYDTSGNVNRSWPAVTSAVDIAVDANRAEVYVLDLETIVTSQVIKYTTDGTEERRWDVKVSGGSQVRGYGIAASRGLVFVDAEGSIAGIDEIYVWMQDGTWMGTMGYAQAPVWQPAGAMDAHDGLFVVCAPSTTYVDTDQYDPLWINVKRHGGNGAEYYGSGFYLGDNTVIQSDSRFGTPFSYITRQTTTLFGDRDDVQTTITVTAEFSIPATAPFVISIGATLIASNERMRVTSKAGLVWDVERGYGGTTAVGHTSGENIYYIYETDEIPVDGDIFYPYEICYDGNYCYVFQKWHEHTTLPEEIGDRYIQVFTNEQTEWYSYKKGVKTSLGTPDGGVNVPERRSLYIEVTDADEVRNHITDMRDAIEALCADNVRSWAFTAFPNAYYASMGDGAKYGGSSIMTTWRKPDLDMAGTRPEDVDIGEVFEIVSDLANNSYNTGWSYL